VWHQLGVRVYKYLDSHAVKWTSIDLSDSPTSITFREAVYTKSTSPQLLNHVATYLPTADIRSPFTPALGPQIAPLKTPYHDGTAALYLREGGESKRVIIVTARYVALPDVQQRPLSSQAAQDACSRDHFSRHQPL